MHISRKYLSIGSAILLGMTGASAVVQSTTPEPGGGYATQDDNDEFPWGLLGLLGLAGLVGLKRKDESEDAVSTGNMNRSR